MLATSVRETLSIQRLLSKTWRHMSSLRNLGMSNSRTDNSRKRTGYRPQQYRKFDLTNDSVGRKKQFASWRANFLTYVPSCSIAKRPVAITTFIVDRTTSEGHQTWLAVGLGWTDASEGEPDLCAPPPFAWALPVGLPLGAGWSEAPEGERDCPSVG